ncbi:MAG: DUF4838 domain-containing protein [Candidatus Hydrogenedentes bacterium]|nr:DUF4838 domain-containing protein [Candidatus Hydrogenedentota bacterium]
MPGSGCVALFSCVVSLFLAEASPAPVLAEGGHSAYCIVRPSDPSPLESRAAAELQSFLEQITGARLPIVSDSEPEREHEIVLGANARLAALGIDLEREQLGDEGFVIKTTGTKLVIAGGRLRGTLYGVYAFLEDRLGCRWFAPGVSRIPARPRLELPAIDERQVPALEYREVLHLSSYDLDWVMRNRLNGDRLPPASPFATERRLQFAGAMFWDLIPPDTYFEAHPEWFSLVDGKRTLVGHYKRTQLCLTNEEMIAEAILNAKKRIRENPDARIFGIFQNDGPGGWCECERCAAVEAAEGGAHSAPVLQFVDRVGKAVREERPDVRIITLAYWYTRPAPKSLKPDPGTIIWITTGKCGSHAIGDFRCEENAPVRDALRDWSRLTNNIYIWDYVVNFRQYLMPFPNLHTLGTNLQYLTENGVRGVLEQGSGTERSDLDALRCYVLAKLLWNPRYDRRTATDEFLEAYYGSAAPPIHAYLDMLEEQVKGTDFHGLHMGPFEERTGPKYLSPAVMAHAAGYFDEAERLVRNDPERLLRVKRARLSIDYTQLRAAACAAGTIPKTEATAFETWFRGSMDAFFATAKETGVEYVKESSRENSYMEAFGKLLTAGLGIRDHSADASAITPGEFLQNIPYSQYIDFDRAAPSGPLFNVSDYGAIGDGKTVNSAAIQSAIDAAHGQGGGTVWVAGGDFVSGTLELKSNVTLRIAKDAVLRASRDPSHYGPAHFIHCDNVQNVRIEGPGRIAGEGDAWWNPPRMHAPVTPPEVFTLEEAKSVHFACKRKKVPGRPSPFIRLMESSDLAVSNLVIENSPGWTLSLDRCERVQVKGVILDNNYHGENTDGIDIVGSSDVDITRCFISTGDDGIVLKNGFAGDASCAMKNIRIAQCAVRSAANCIKIGTETWSDISDVLIEDCRLFTEGIWPWAISAIAVESVDGAAVRNVTAQNITVQNVTTPLFIRLGNRNRWKDKDRAGAVEHISIRQLAATGVEFPCVISGIPGLYAKDIVLEDIEIAYRAGGEKLDISTPVPEAEDEYPEAWMFGDLPAYALYARHVDGLAVRNFRVTPRSVNEREALVFDDVQNLKMDD